MLAGEIGGVLRLSASRKLRMMNSWRLWSSSSEAAQPPVETQRELTRAARRPTLAPEGAGPRSRQPAAPGRPGTVTLAIVATAPPGRQAKIAVHQGQWIRNTLSAVSKPQAVTIRFKLRLRRQPRLENGDRTRARSLSLRAFRRRGAEWKNRAWPIAAFTVSGWTGLGDQEDRLGPLAGQQAFGEGGDEDHRHIELGQDVLQPRRCPTSRRPLDVGQHQAERCGAMASRASGAGGGDVEHLAAQFPAPAPRCRRRPPAHLR